MNVDDIVRETKWLVKNPAFERRPATIREFLKDPYLNIFDRVRPGLIKALEEIFGTVVNSERLSHVERAMLTGAIGIGKTTFASIALPYMTHWVLCLKDPQGFYGLLPGSRIAFMQMSTSRTHARDVIFSDIKARINNSKWFAENFPYDTTFTNQLRFPKDIWILPGDSGETTFEGYNILAGILDEMDSHKATSEKDYADQGFTTIESRIASRFVDNTDPDREGHRGLIIAIGQMKKSHGFAARKYKELKIDPRAKVVSMTIWESFGWDKYLNADGSRRSFHYDIRRKQIVPSGIAALVENPNIIEVPRAFKRQFENHPEKALRDLAGIPPQSEDSFISLADRVDDCRTRWIERHGDESPVSDSPVSPKFAKWFVANNDPRRRAVHIDLATSGDGDALGFAMGHIEKIVEVDGEKKPYIVFDCLLRIKATSGTEIMISDVRRIIYHLRDDRHFRIKSVTMDGFQCFSGDTKIPLLDGRTLTMKELAEQHPDGGVWTYSIDDESKRIVPGRITKAWRTATKKVLEVHLDNGEIVRCTPDHRFLLRDGSYCQAGELKVNQSLMPLYRRVVTSETGHLDRYEQVAQPGERNTSSRTENEWAPSRWEYTHRMVAGDVEEGYVRHHEDHNPLNNSPENLSVITRGEHHAHHHQKQFWTEERRQSVGEAISRSNSERTGEDARRYRHDVTIKELLPYAHLSRRKVTELTGWSQDMIYARLREAGFNGWKEFRERINHRVVKIVWTGEVEDVYDLSVEKYNNFALDAGVFVHNSTDTLQQLRKKRMEADYVSVDKTTLPYEDLREAIYENRVEFPPYLTYLKLGADERVEIAIQELLRLQYDGRKVDHPTEGSKDVADAMAGVCYRLMGDRNFRKGVVSLDEHRQRREQELTGTDAYALPPETPRIADIHSGKLGAPPPAGTDLGFVVPMRLRPR